ncbi:bifunctional nicotinamide-nucleotide adenylyltransferase/Nudix hydroxylase [Aquirhabdus sp.]|uniref:bifunctional nicotinamide-nucleotide adenylyltransferase/Nudix hydroxylase n=1 Tax=Aquirhabdus sp. TaxID=2824160 RepID=UPI00396C6FE3
MNNESEIDRSSNDAFDFDYLVFIGRFQPFHFGHESVIRAALARSRQVIVLIGSAFLPRSTRNAFSYDERVRMILAAFHADDAKRIHCVPLNDCLYNDTRWVVHVQQSVASVVDVDYQKKDKARIGLIGHSKDKTSYYPSLFPHWPSVPVENYQGLSATPIRESYLLGAMPQPDRVPESTSRLLTEFKKTSAYALLQEEAWFIDTYRKQWERSPYPPTFVTVDAVVVQSGHILLVERKAMPGRGLWALPGGFIGERETLVDACIRELREETRLKVPDPVLRGSLHGERSFDDPYRSARGRTITHAFYFALKNDPEGLPRVKGGDDAKSAFWVPLANVTPDLLYEDHYAIMNEMIGL